jgi:nickel/cobalt exporter
MGQCSRPVTRMMALPLAFSLMPAPAFAHLVNTSVGDFYAGMLHPLTSIEHLWPAAALVLLAGRCNAHVARWTVAVFPPSLIAGVIVGQAFTHLTFVHPTSLVAMIALGLLLTAGYQPSMRAMAIATVSVGLLLGYRSGVDMAHAAVGLQFIPGVALTGFIMAALGSAWSVSTSSLPVAAVLRLTGGGVAVAGAYLLLDFIIEGAPVASRTIGFPTEERLLALMTAETLTLPVIGAAFLAACGWGAAHALTPGHGKAIVGAYLVGSRGTAGHALYLGLTVTVTHTIGVFALGLVALLASRYVLAEQLFPWFSVGSGLIVSALGASMLAARVRSLSRPHTPHEPHHHAGHHHDHEHEHGRRGHQHAPVNHRHGHPHLPPGADGAAVTVRSLLGLGISGGLLPCPSALALLLTAMSLQRTGFGLFLLTAFSLGLAGVLTGVGLLFLKGRALLRDAPGVAGVSRYVPAVSAAVILLLGVGITVEALWRLASVI